MLFNNNFSFGIRKLFCDRNGRYIICDMEIDQKCITLETLCVPSDDDPSFLDTLLVHWLDFECDDLILGGDFNLVLDVDTDKKGWKSHYTHAKCVKLLDTFLLN